MNLLFHFIKTKERVPEQEQMPCILLEIFEGKLHVSFATWYEQGIAFLTESGEKIYAENVLAWCDVSHLHGADPEILATLDFGKFVAALSKPIP